MRSSRYLVFALAVMVATAAVAGPVGIYDVSGKNPDDGSTYAGVVAVENNGATYTVIWNVDNHEYIGTGVGAAIVKGSMTFGGSAENDTAIAVSYVSHATFGLALFSEQATGQWKGIWTDGDSNKIGTEIWTPRS